MKKKLLLAGLLTTFSLVAKCQVGVNTTNPQGIFNIDGLKNNPTTGVPTAIQAKDDLVMTSNGNLGLGITSPGTTLDVNGAITNRETILVVAGNAVSIPVNVSLVRLTGAATANVAITAFAAPNPGQRLIVYNNTMGGFGATLDGITIPNGKALEFVFTNSFWRATDGGATGASPVNIYTADGTLNSNRTVTQGANTLAFTGTQTNAFSVDGSTFSVDAANDRVGVGTVAPTNKLVVLGANAQPSALGTAATNATFRVDGNTNHAMDFGTYTNAPFGSYISSQNKTAAAGLPLVLNPAGGNVGVAISSPGTSLDVNGAITNRETSLAVSGNAVTVPVNVSQVQLTGAATATVAITAPTAPNPGQRLIVYNNTTGGFGATLNGTTIPNGEALEFVFSNTQWRSTDGGTVGAAPVNIYTANGTLTGNRTVTQGANTLSFTGTQTNAFSVDGNTLSVDAANNRVGIGTTAPSSLLSVQNNPGATTSTISAGIENCGIPCGQGISRNISLYNLNGTGGQFAELAFIPSTSETGLSGATITGIDRDVTNSYAGLQFFTRNATGFAPRLTIKSSGNIGIGTTTPGTTLDVAASPTDLTKKDGITPPRLTRQELTNKGNALYTASERGTMIYITDISGGNATSQRININDIGYYYFDGSVWQKMTPDISTPQPAYFRLTADISNFLSAQGIGQSTRVFNLSQVKNAIPGLTYNASTSTITFPAGTFQITFVYEASHNATGCTLSSYYLDFPEGTGNTRVHSTSSHAEGGNSNHGGSIIYTTTVAGGTTWQVNLGRGQSGNCLGTGMLLKARSTHMLIFKIGD